MVEIKVLQKKNKCQGMVWKIWKKDQEPGESVEWKKKPI